MQTSVDIKKMRLKGVQRHLVVTTLVFYTL